MRPNRSLIGTNRFSANWDTWGFDDPRTQCGRDSALPLRGFFFASRVNRLLPKSGNIEGASTIMAPRKFSGPIQQGAIRVLRDMEVASTSDIMPITHPRQHNPPNIAPEVCAGCWTRSQSESDVPAVRGRRSSGGSSPSFGNEFLLPFCYPIGRHATEHAGTATRLRTSIMPENID